MLLKPVLLLSQVLLSSLDQCLRAQCLEFASGCFSSKGRWKGGRGEGSKGLAQGMEHSKCCPGMSLQSP